MHETVEWFAAHSKVRLQWPKTGAAVTKRANATRSALADWSAALPPPVAAFSATSAALEIAPALSAALAPPQDTLDGLLLGRPKNPAAVQALVDHMLDYGVVYDLGAGQRLQGAPVGAEETPCDGAYACIVDVLPLVRTHCVAEMLVHCHKCCCNVSLCVVLNSDLRWMDACNTNNARMQVRNT